MTVSALTPKRVRTAITKSKPYVIHDRKLKGFGLKVATSGRKTFEINFTRKGHRHRETIGDADNLSLKEARAAAKTRMETLTALNTVGPDTKFETIAELALYRHERLWKPSTSKVARRYIDVYILPYLKGRTVASITRSDVETWFADLHETPGAANRAKALLSVIIGQAEDVGIRPEGSNPVLGLRKYNRPRMERVLSPDELARLGAALEARKESEPLMVAMLQLYILTGCRKGELRHLQWHEYRDGNLHLQDSKTGPKTVFLSSHARAVLDGIKTKRTGLVFPPHKNGKRGIVIGAFWRVLRREVGLEDVRLHDFRHTYASTAIRQGESLTVVGTLLGHISPQTTMGYTHLDDMTMQEAIEAVGKSMTQHGGDVQ